MNMHHVSVKIALTLTLIQGPADPNHENNKCSIILETLFKQCRTRDVCCEDTPTYNLCQSDDLDLHSRSQLRLKLYKFSCNF